jgi:hypothetical protein
LRGDSARRVKRRKGGEREGQSIARERTTQGAREQGRKEQVM